ncbi:MAG: hypothetical protein BWZ10_01532 [candidate division BRC1 bacterium ADurb.BinA364]|nr:MAG: hypothetical protein BWZ10_01532 [candidate division BRC1 bacterium ADurb.BinA364]
MASTGTGLRGSQENSQSKGALRNPQKASASVARITTSLLFKQNQMTRSTGEGVWFSSMRIDPQKAANRIYP